MEVFVALYRISSNASAKARLPGATKEACLANFCAVLGGTRWPHGLRAVEVIVLADQCTAELTGVVRAQLAALQAGWRGPDLRVRVQALSVGHGAGTFRKALEIVKGSVFGPPEAVACYMVEDDYVHARGAIEGLLEGLTLAPYVSLYDHADKYAGGHFVGRSGGELARVLVGATRHWRTASSTTMTFAARQGTVQADATVWELFTMGTYPHDFGIWAALYGSRGRALVTPLPSLATHADVAFLAPLVDWGAALQGGAGLAPGETAPAPPE
jgi:hypothetical protein